MITVLFIFILLITSKVHLYSLILYHLVSVFIHKLYVFDFAPHFTFIVLVVEQRGIILVDIGRNIEFHLSYCTVCTIVHYYIKVKAKVGAERRVLLCAELYLGDVVTGGSLGFFQVVDTVVEADDGDETVLDQDLNTGLVFSCAAVGNIVVHENNFNFVATLCCIVNLELCAVQELVGRVGLNQVKAEGVSNNGIFIEIGKLINGGYYEELNYYESVKSSSTKVEL